MSSGVVLAAPAAHHALATAPAALPSSRLEFGLSNFDSTWMTSSGVPWRYRFQYLSGGVNTGAGWETWNSPPGQFAAYYMTNSTTAPANYIPVFSYYELLQSNPSTGSSEKQRDFNNLNNAATMNAYYANFKLLMQKAGAYGSQVVVQVEPDFWGYMQQQAAGGGATAVTAMVKSSGFAEASAFANNLAGFASELKFLRDTYAPNASLAMHASMWSSGIDIASNTDPNLNAVGEADKTAAFLNSAGAGSWDAIFNDVDDHNAAWWELASCGSPPCVNQFYTHWWDPANVTFPNFSRYLSWVGELHAQTGRPQVVWQVPMGNQYFLTMNNTCGHYQDNVAPYFISHPSQLFNAGLVAVMFGAGNACQTSYDDSRHDGITNNNGNATTDLLGGCNACNLHPSSVSDDDGGYLRIFVGQYYAGQTSCASAGLGASPSPPRLPGTQVLFTASSSGCTSPVYEFWLQSPNGTWTLKQPYGPSATWNWDTTGFAPGTYAIHVWASQSTGNLSTWEAMGAATYSLQTPSPCFAAGISPANASQAAGSTVSMTASSSGCLNPRYAFYVQYPGGTWYLKQGFGGPAFSWDTTGQAPGTYIVHAWVNTTGSGHDDIGSARVTLTGCTSASVAPPGVSAPAGSTVNLTASSMGCANPTYEFWVQYPNGTWNLARGFGGPTFALDTTGLALGTYTVHAWANQTGAATTLEAYGTSMVTLTGCTSALVAPPTATQEAGSTVNLTASSSGCLGPRYAFYVQDSSGTWSLKQGFGGPAFNWDTSGLRPGTYLVHAWVNSSGTGHEVIGSAIVTLTGCTSSSVAPPSGSAAVGTKVTFTATGGGCTIPVYEFWLQYPDGSWHLKQAFSTINTWQWDSAGLSKGNYVIHVWTNQQGADTNSYETIGSATYTLT